MRFNTVTQPYSHTISRSHTTIQSYDFTQSHSHTISHSHTTIQSCDFTQSHSHTVIRFNTVTQPYSHTISHSHTAIQSYDFTQSHSHSIHTAMLFHPVIPSHNLTITRCCLWVCDATEGGGGRSHDATEGGVVDHDTTEGTGSGPCHYRGHREWTVTLQGAKRMGGRRPMA